MDRNKFMFISFIVLLVVGAFVGTLRPIIHSNISREDLCIAKKDPIPYPSDTITVGKLRSEIVDLLGEPTGQSSDSTIYYYFRHIQEIDKEQVFVVTFQENIVFTVDSNIKISHNTQ